MWTDDLGFAVRSSLPFTKDKDKTSFGNTSVQIHTAALTLGYNPKQLTQSQRSDIINTLEDPVQGIYVSAMHLSQLKEIDFENKKSSELTDEEISIIATRYNVGPDEPLRWVRENNGYGQNVVKRIPKLKRLLGI